MSLCTSTVAIPFTQWKRNDAREGNPLATNIIALIEGNRCHRLGRRADKSPPLRKRDLLQVVRHQFEHLARQRAADCLRDEASICWPQQLLTRTFECQACGNNTTEIIKHP